MGSMNNNLDNMRDTISSGISDASKAAQDGIENLGNLANDKILNPNGGLSITTTVSICLYIYLVKLR